MGSSDNINKLGARFYYGEAPSKSGGWERHYAEEQLKDYSTYSRGGLVEVHFDKIEDRIVEGLSRATIAVGAVAWLTNPRILAALAKVERVAIVVQKEDFLRRDAAVTDYPQWRRNLHQLYRSLNGLSMIDMPESYPGLQEEHPWNDPVVDHWVFNQSGEFVNGGSPIRCIGYHSTSRSAMPRMHHKFLVLGQRHEGFVMVPNETITGSFNMTFNATRSRENILVLQNLDIARAYLREWSQLWAASEPLDWTSPEPVFDTLDMGT